MKDRGIGTDETRKVYTPSYVTHQTEEREVQNFPIGTSYVVIVMK